VLLFAFISSSLFSQQDDHRNWSFTKFSFSINETWKMDVIPIYRFVDDLSTFSSASIDIALKREIGDGLTAGVLSRTWYFPGKKVRQFLWLDLVHKLPNFGLPISAKQRLRYHGGVNLPDWEEDRDFIRYYVGVVGKFGKSKVQPTFAIEPFYRLNRKNYVERFRINYGLQVKANKNLRFIGFMSQQQMYDFEETYTQFLWHTGIHYIFDNPVIKKQVIN